MRHIVALALTDDEDKDLRLILAHYGKMLEEKLKEKDQVLIDHMYHEMMLKRSRQLLYIVEQGHVRIIEK